MIRRAQQPITIRSDRAAARLKLLTRDGRSQVRVIEEALERFEIPELEVGDFKQRRAELEALLDRFDLKTLPTMVEFDYREYDDSGNPR